MNSQAFTTFAPAMFGSGLLFVVFLYLGTLYRERALFLWTCAWALWTVRRGWAVVADSLLLDQLPLLLVVLVYSYLTLMVLGAAAFTGRRVGHIWFPVAAVGLVDAAVRGAPSVVLGTGVIVFGWALGGVLLFRARGASGPERIVPAIAMLLMAVATLRIPLVGDDPVHAAWGSAAVFAIQSMLGVGMVLVLHGRERVRLETAGRRRDAALTRALSGYIPICAGCKSVAEGSRWIGLEDYLGARAAVAVSHGICPACAAALYPEYVD